MLKNPVIKNVLSALTVAAVGFLLLNLTFLFYAAVAWMLEKLIIPGSTPMERPWFMPISFAVATVLIAIISWLVLKSKLATLYKAIFMTVPSAVTFSMIGITLYRWPVLAYTVGGLVGAGILTYFYVSKKPWLYFYAVILVGLALAIFTLLGGEI